MPCEWCTGPRLDVLLDVMRSSPQVLQFVPHICQHAEELGAHLEALADHIDELGVCTAACWYPLIGAVCAALYCDLVYVRWWG